MRSFPSLRFCLTLVVASLFGTALSNLPARATAFDDDFGGKILDAKWTPNIPQEGATITVNNGLKITTNDAVFDNWSNVAHAPEIATPVPPGDFEVSAEIGPIVSPDGDPAEDRDYQAALTLSFGQFDVITLGAFRSNEFIQMDRSGRSAIGQSVVDSNPIWVRLKKTGAAYAAFYKTSEADPWLPLLAFNGLPAVVNETKPPLSVGLMFKTWSSVPATATFHNFHLEGEELSLPATLAGTVTVTGGTPDQVRVQVVDKEGNVKGVGTPGADGAYGLSIGSGTYTVRLSGYPGVSSSPGSSKAGVVILPDVTTIVDLNAVIPAPPSVTSNLIFQDDFAGTSLNPAWNTMNNQGNISVHDGLSFKLPKGTFDHWTTYNNAPHIYMAAPSGDFIATAQLRSVVDPNGQPVEKQSYHSTMTLYFSDNHFDALMYGAYHSNKTIRLEKTGDGLASGNIPALPAWIQIRKSGSDYTFFYRATDNEAWTPLFGNDGSPLVYTRADAPLAVGLEQKTSDDGVELTATWNRFILQNNAPQPVAKLGDLNGDGKINVQDATASLRIAVRVITPTDLQALADDVNFDGKLNVQDTTLILRMAVGAISAFQ